MEKEQGSVASSASVTIPSTTSASIVSNSSDRQQAVPQISVYGGITDRQTVQVERNLNDRQSIATSYSPYICVILWRHLQAMCSNHIINQLEGLIHH